MESAEAITSIDPLASADVAIPNCPECDAPCTAGAVQAPSLISLKPLHRCQKCGTRFCWASGIARPVVTCRRCCLPIAICGSDPMAGRVCADCAESDESASPLDDALARATDSELRAALETRLRFVEHSTLGPYLRRIVRTLCSVLENMPVELEVLVFDDEIQRGLMLPSGSLLLSTASLAGLNDEAELAFILGREFLRFERGEVADRTVRVGLAAAAGHQGEWANVADDLMRLGYGSEREYAVDAGAIELMAAVGYSPEAALRYLRRQVDRVNATDPAVSELAQAGPPFAMRLSRLEMKVRGAVLPGEERSNREPFRRVIGGVVLSSKMQPVPGPVLVRHDERLPRRFEGPVAWVIAAVLFAIALGVLVRQLLSDL